MKCDEFIDKLEYLSETGITEEMKQHIAECDDCRDYYLTISALSPKIYPKAPESIKINVLKKIKRKEQIKEFFTMKNKISKIAASIAGIAAVALSIILISHPSLTHAQKIINESLTNATKVKSMIMKIDVRTAQKENFDDIDINEPMIEHTLTVVRGDENKWRIDKGWRSIVFDGTNKYMWAPDNSLSVKGNKNTNFEEWFDILLDPEMTLLNEKVSTDDKGSKYTVNESGNEIVMTANIKAKGDFTNPYMRNTSIEESDTRREIIFDKDTKLIKSMKVYVKNNSQEMLVVDVKNIQYDVPINETELTAIPEGKQWHDVNTVIVTSGKFTNITPEEAAKIIFNSFENDEPELIKEAFINYNFNEIMKTYKGIKVIRLGKSFKSGIYSGVFVPYEIRLPDGKIEKGNIALKNDNPDKVWIVDGGI